MKNGFRGLRRFHDRIEVRRAATLYTSLCALLAMTAGCTFHVGLDGVSGSLLGSNYHHAEKFDAEGDRTDWSTVAGRTWGTVDVEWRTDDSEEKGSIRGGGMSTNLQKTLGEDALEEIADVVSQNLRPGGQLEGAFSERLGEIVSEKLDERNGE